MSKAKLIRKVSEEIVLREDIKYDGEQVYYDGEAVFYEHPPINSSQYECQIEENPTPSAIRHIEADIASTRQNGKKTKPQPEKLSAKARVLAVWTEHHNKSPEAIKEYLRRRFPHWNVQDKQQTEHSGEIRIILNKEVDP